MPGQTDLIWIEDAASEYGRSRVWLKEQVSAGVLSYAKIPGDRKVYLLRSELDVLLRQPRIMRHGATPAPDTSDSQHERLAPWAKSARKLPQARGSGMRASAGDADAPLWLTRRRAMQIHPIERDDASPVVQRLYDALEKQSGSVTNFNKMLAHKPEILRAYNQLSSAVWAAGSLPEKLKDLAYLRTSILNGCEY